jgi:acyl-CoA synthetase (NDP forming)
MEEVQGVKSYKNPGDLPQVDVAILAIAAKYCYDTIKLLADKKNTRGFIILSAGFSEESEEGGQIEQAIVAKINEVGGSLIGPNCIGLLTPDYNGVFGVSKGLSFSSLWSVGNSAQIGVEEVLSHLDETYDPQTSSPVKLLYIENINNPDLLLKHASSLIRKGCKIAAIKAGGSEAGSRAAGIVRCHGREQLITVGAVFMHPELEGKNMVIITHAGGPAVMLTDALSNGGMEIPHLEGPKADALLEKLFPGSAVGNPSDFLATGTAEQLGYIIDACEHDFDNIDGMAVIFGSPGLCPVYDVYDLLHEKMKTCKKPIFPILPSVINVKDEIDDFVAKGRINFPDEKIFGDALCKVYHIPKPQPEKIDMPDIDTQTIRQVVENADNGYFEPVEVAKLLDAAGIKRANDKVVNSVDEAIEFTKKHGFPVVMKVVGPVHKSDVGGVVLNVRDEATVRKEYERLMKIKDTYAVQMFEMYFGEEIFIGAKREEKFGHMVLCGMGGVFIEELKDVQSALAPVSKQEAQNMIRRLNSYPLLKGTRGQEGINEDMMAEQITRVAALVYTAPEIFEMDLNPLLGNPKEIVAVDARIRIEKD